MQWLHFSSLAMLIGGILYGRLVMAPASAALAPDEREALGDRAAAAFRPFVWPPFVGLVVSGVYNILTHPPQADLPVLARPSKLLLAAARVRPRAADLRPGNPRRARDDDRRGNLRLVHYRHRGLPEAHLLAQPATISFCGADDRFVSSANSEPHLALGRPQNADGLPTVN